MKKTILAIAMLLVTVSINAQDFYVALSGGPTWGADQQVLNQNSGFKGSYGEGYQGQLRFGYMINEKFGVDLGVGYLHGDTQQIMETPANITGKARAFGVALTGLYNISENVYVRGGLLSKLGGKTKVEGSVNTVTQTTQGPAPLSIDFTRDNTGSFPLGFIAAFGVKFDLGSNWGIFAEMEYQGINVPAEKSALGDFAATIGGQSVDKATVQGAVAQQLAGLLALSQANPRDPRLAALPTVATLNNLIADEVTFVDNPTLGKPEATSTEAPYSSFGFSFGVTYSFDFK